METFDLKRLSAALRLETDYTVELEGNTIYINGRGFLFNGTLVKTGPLALRAKNLTDLFYFLTSEKVLHLTQREVENIKRAYMALNTPLFDRVMTKNHNLNTRNKLIY